MIMTFLENTTPQGDVLFNNSIRPRREVGSAFRVLCSAYYYHTSTILRHSWVGSQLLELYTGTKSCNLIHQLGALL